MNKDIKQIWKSENYLATLKEKEIDDIIQQNSSSVLDQIKRNLRHEFTIVCFVYPLAIIAFLYFSIYTGAGLFLGAFIAMIFYYLKLNSKLNLNAIAFTNYEYLKISYQRLKEYMSYYKIFGIIFLLSSFVLGLEYGGFFENVSTMIAKFSYSKILIFLVALLMIFTVFLFGFIKYIDHKHAKKLRNLKSLLNDLEEINRI